ncbi:hypothetical protein F0562_022211 [Nyssa sinensis]|uniref:Uncharacterized protein n=1 Tax=Nyssa sinensis TaxID=561372 RepID=A0A5J5BM11_9ASTE|nr:hypothetical protein F0562_022211 [Nyssa sinensis]
MRSGPRFTPETLLTVRQTLRPLHWWLDVLFAQAPRAALTKSPVASPPKVVATPSPGLKKLLWKFLGQPLAE